MSARKQSASPSLSKKDLLAAISLVSPALGSPTFVPILSHLCFDGVSVSAYNDVVGISTRCEVEFAKTVPGDLITKLLGSLTQDAVNISEDDDKPHVILTAGSSKLTIPALPAKDYVFEFPDPDNAQSTLPLDESIIDGIELCLVSVGTDSAHPSQMGVTIECRDKLVRLYSTDNFTMSRYTTDSADGWPHTLDPMIMPTDFCKALVNLARKFQGEEMVLHVYAGAVFARIGSAAQVFAKLVSTVSHSNFDTAFKRFLGGKSAHWITLPADWDPCFERASIIMRAEQDRVARVSAEANEIEIEATSKIGQQFDRIECEEVGDRVTFGIDPDLVLRGSKYAWKVMLGREALCMMSKDGNFTHMISHCEV